METTVKLREQFKSTQIEDNFANAIKLMDEVCFIEEYQVKVNGELIDGLSNLTLNKSVLSNLSKNARKNLAKRIHFFDKKQSLKSMNTLFSVFFRKGVLDDKYSIKIGNKEVEINRLRDIYKIMKVKSEEARLAYKKEKGNFYKEKLAC